eukprot:TRINITY_DN5891_c0_g1_i1.p1 TRINITY_DN5891_c0_g1~~TRINITY_DN5891_c0_g1_i1.p1  ORF type:complete len:262 (+),score=34.30 TRINITY_DN5891_c0_g1_i1:145-930(+)
MVNWSKHFKHENPDFSQTFKEVIRRLSEYFDVEVYATRLNFYADGTAWKPFHHDSHAYEGREQREDFTMGVSFGASRQLLFLHPISNQTFSFPQNNGDIFAFTSEANKRFQHGVPKTNQKIGPRFSIIAWGRRRSINERNAAKEELLSAQYHVILKQPSNKKQDVIERQLTVITNNNKPHDYEKLEDEKSDLDIEKVVELVKDFIIKERSTMERTNKKEYDVSGDKGSRRGGGPKKSRIQGSSWSQQKSSPKGNTRGRRNQ